MRAASAHGCCGAGIPRPGLQNDCDWMPMLELIGNLPAARAARVLCIGAHCDDIEIGCAATMLALQAGRPRLEINWVVASGPPQRRTETERAMGMLVRRAARGTL